MPSEPVALSVVICTRNRAAKLRNALAALERMAAPVGLNWEVLVVDNGSTDDTRSLVETAAAQCPFPLRYAFEPRPGASHARNTAIHEAQGTVIASIDDDCLPQDDWLAEVIAAFEADPSLDVVGGRVELYNKTDKAITIRTETTAYQVTRPGQIFASIPGCNIAYRRALACAIGGFDTRFGPGAPIPAAEDPDFLYRALKQGAKLAYRPQICVQHDHGRQTDDDVFALEKNYIRGRGGFYAKHLLRGDRQILRMAYWETGALVKAILAGWRHRRPVAEELHVLKSLFSGAGRLLALSLKR